MTRTWTIRGTNLGLRGKKQAINRLSSSHALFPNFISERDFITLQSFYKVCTQSNQQLALGS